MVYGSLAVLTNLEEGTQKTDGWANLALGTMDKGTGN